MQKENLKYAEYPRFRVHWSVKLLGLAWAVALVFIIGMVIGGMLGFVEEPPEGAANEAAEQSEYRVLEVSCLDQRREFPTGCESVTAVMALNYAGVDISAGDFVDLYLPKGSAPYESNGEAPYSVNAEYLCADPNEYFLGDPRSEGGWGCYAPVIKSAVLAVLKDHGSEREVLDLCGLDMAELVDGYIAKGIPVMVWATQGMEEPRYGDTLTVEGSGRQFDWIRPEHCLLLVGESEGEYLFNDPLEGKTVAYEKKAAERAYEAQGRQALAIR
jgi:uncharacterized protein YvpB